MLNSYSYKCFSVISLFILFQGSIAFAQNGLTGYKYGEGGSPVSGSAAGTNAAGESSNLEKCSSPMGTIALVEPQSHILAALSRYSLPSPSGLLRLMIQQSGCFQVVERGRAMKNIMQERNLSQSGQLQSNANVGKGQLVTADFLMTPNVVFKDKNAGGAGIGAALGSLFGSAGGAISTIAAGLKFQEAQTTLMVSDTRSGLQVASATGSVKKADWGLGGILGGVGGGAYTSTDEGKIVAAALLDNYNNVVRSIRQQPQLLAPTSEVANANAEASLKANIPEEGAVLKGKIKGVKVYKSADKKSQILYTLKKNEEVVFLGDHSAGYYFIVGEDGEGWVRSSLVK